jgi:hypothetical protein
MIMAQRIERRPEGDWEFCRYDDGTEQWMYKNTTNYFAERVVDTKSRRKRWAVVQRGGYFTIGQNDPISPHRDVKYPPKVVGSFADAEGAKVALKLIVESKGA